MNASLQLINKFNCVFVLVLQTFCVISQKYNRHYIYRFSCTKSLYLLGPLNPIRRFAIFVVTHRWFDILIILTILANCVTLAMIQNKFEEDGVTKVVPDYDYYTDRIEWVFISIFFTHFVIDWKINKMETGD